MPHSPVSAFAALERTPLEARDLPPSPYAAIARAAGRFPDRPALTFLESGAPGAAATTLSYRQFLAELHRTANALRRLGVEPGDVVTLLLPNVPEYHPLFWGAQVAGVANPSNPALEVEPLGGLLRSARSSVLVTLSPAAGPDLWAKAAALAGTVPSVRAVVAVDPDRAARPSPPLPRLPVPVAYLHELTATQPDTLTFDPSVEPQRVSALFHTGGTTGRPKLAQHTQHNEVFDAWTCALATGMRETDVLLCGLPLFHVNGLIVTGLAPLTVGAQVVLATRQGYRDPSVLPHFWSLVETHRVSVFSGVPAIYSTLLNLPAQGRDLSSLRFGICGAAPMPPALLQAFERKTGLTVLEGYGLTEATCVSTVNPPAGERKSGSIGLPLPYHRLRVAALGPDGSWVRDASVGEVGTLLLHGPNVFPGYVEAAHNADLWVEAGGERWLNTGDLARLDEQGYVFLAGRRKELIIRGGHNIDPLVIEEAFARHPQVALAAAVGRPDPYAGELPVVYVQLRPGGTVSADELLAFARPHIAERPALPRAVRMVPALPMTGVGKIFKPQLVWAEIRDELGLALGRAGITARVEVGLDASQRVLATVTADPGQFGQARAVLEAYAVPFTLEAGH